ncbi:alpha/beta fold hydrolase [Jatrophihabitans sp. YIM 134969]
MFVTEDGPPDAPVVLLVHGFSSSSRSWDLVVPTLARAHRVVRVDLLGHGRTGGAAADSPVQAAAVQTVLAERGLTDVTAVGHSFGADVAVELAERGAPVTGLVIVAQAPDYSDAHLPRAGALMTGRIGPSLYRGVRPVFGAVAAVAEHRPARDLLARRGQLAGLAAVGLRDLQVLDPVMFRTVLVDRRDRMARRPLDAQVAAAHVPTLVLLGGRDHFYGDRSAARYRAAGARVEVVAASGHAMPVEFPAETAAFIAEFVSERTAPHPG